MIALAQMFTNEGDIEDHAFNPKNPASSTFEARREGTTEGHREGFRDVIFFHLTSETPLALSQDSPSLC